MGWRQAQDLRESWTASTPVTGGEVAGERLNLDALARIAERAPLGEPLRALLAGLAPRGLLDSLKARWSGPLDQPASYQVDARLSDLALQAAEPLPAAARATRPAPRQAAAVGQRARGRGKSGIKDGALVFPGLWEQPEVPVDELQAALPWRIVATPGQPSAIEVKLTDTRVGQRRPAG